MTIAQDKLKEGHRPIPRDDVVTLMNTSNRLMGSGVKNIINGNLYDLHTVGTHVVLDLVGETDPGTDSAYASAPIGSTFKVIGQSSGTVTTSKMLYKVASGSDGWREILTEGLKVQTITTTTGTISADSDIVFIDYTTTGTVSVTMPAASAMYDSTNGTTRKTIIIDKDGNANTNNITLDGNASETINGSPNYVMDADNEAVTIVSDGTNLYIAGGYLE